MNYEKKYNALLGRARDYYEDKNCFKYIKGILKDLFPELSETEDKRIRNGLIALLKFGLEDGSTIAPGSNVTKEQAIDWLEKQGEQKPKRVGTKEAAGTLKEMLEDIDPIELEETRREMLEIDGFDSELNALLKKYKHLPKEEVAECLEFYLGVVQGEQKPKWTEEDEERLQSCISSFQGKGLMGGVDTIDTKWLKSLKQRMIIKIKTWGFPGNDEKEAPENLIPELKESEDEKIRKELINRINGLWENDAVMWPSTLEEKNKYIGWLEKQGNQESFIDDLEMTLSVSEDAYLRGNIEGLIKEFKNDTRR